MNSSNPKHPELALKNQFFEVYIAGATKSLNDLSKPSVTLPEPHGKHKSHVSLRNFQNVALLPLYHG